MADSSGKTRKLLKDRTPVHREEVFKKIRAEGADLSWLNARRHRAAGYQAMHHPTRCRVS
jgi:hypothetical protein